MAYCIQYVSNWLDGRVVMQRPAKPFTPVRFRLQPPNYMNDNLLNNLNNIFDKNDIKVDSLNKEKYRNDWSTNYQSDPLAIVFPREANQVHETIKLCNDLDFPLIGSGGRTGLSGGASALSNELIISFDKMNKIIDFDESTKTVLCESGLITEQLQSFAIENNLFYPVDFSSAGSSQIGGNIATNAGGIKVIKYGSTAKYVKGLNIITGNGNNISTDNSLVKNATGPDINYCFIGSEGIFGLTTSCRIQLINQPTNTDVALIGFDSIESLNSITQLALEHDVEAIEFFTKNSLLKVDKEFNDVDIGELNNNYYFIIEYEDSINFNPVLEKIFKSNLSDEIIISTNNNQKESIWSYRLLISESISRDNPIKFDIAVPIKHTSDLIRNLESYFKKNMQYTLILFGHIGDGNLHINIIRNDKNIVPGNDKILEKKIYSMVLELKGTLSAEHGIGHKKVMPFMKYEKSLKINLIKNLKNFFDNKGVLNPGKLVQ